MGRKVYFTDSDAAHDFSQKIGAGGIDIESQGNNTYNTYVVDTSNASWSKDNPYGNDPDKK